MSDNAVAPLETAFGVDHHVTRAEAPERPVQDGGPEMVQLLSPEGERVPHPEHDAVIDALSDGGPRHAGLPGSSAPTRW